ncbi:Fungal specific transcription factor [Cordyceps fumosorosea ARSEF 2679]|uniref:Fungal specific transcription factor n=1 Tax=Cordyceps fumosorosea (strain ARSEF 2679) TaxID=1081104 RepID=A0A162LEP7_CORFA|nr:Fungal specific transcription factor [Cordyceps fumosorosea ARSEF 2679]OAA69594.1 Fungal specific transcription factor [Cordyceps fumosorosea ARSEF 2679]
MNGLTTDPASVAGNGLRTLNPQVLTTPVSPRYLRELEGRKAQDDRMLDPVAAPRRVDVDALLTQPSPSTSSSRAAFGLHPRDVAQHNDHHNHGQDSNGQSSQGPILSAESSSNTTSGPTPSLAPDTGRLSYHSSHGSSVDDHNSIEPSFMQNPLADNDYTFTKMKGRFWYMGPSSSWSFCRRVLTLLGQHLPDQGYVADPGHFDGGHKLVWNAVPCDETPDVSNLPPLDYALLLFNVAKFYLGSIFYLIDEQDWLRNLYELYEDQSAKAASSRHWYAQYLLILAYGKVFITNQSSAEGPTGHQYAARAMALMPDLSGLAPDSMTAVQALVLGSVYLQSIDMRVGALQHVCHAMRICIIEGWHRHMPVEVVGVQHSQRCNLIFWVVYKLEREFGSLMGAPSSIRDEDITARAPSDLNDCFDARNMALHVRLARLVSKILNAIYGVGQRFDGSLVTNTQSVLRDLAQISRDVHALLESHFQGSISKASRMAVRLLLSYHHCVVLTTRPVVMCALHMHIKRTNSIVAGPVMLSTPVASLLQSCVNSAQTVLRILRVIGDEDLLEAFLPFQLEDAYSSAFVLYLVRTICPFLVPDDNWEENMQSVLDKMISKGSIVAPVRKMELAQLERFMNAFTPPAPAGSNAGGATGAGGNGAAHGDDHHMSEQGHGHDDNLDTPLTPSVAADEPGWDLFQTDTMIGISPGEMLDLAAQLELNNPLLSALHE